MCEDLLLHAAAPGPSLYHRSMAGCPSHSRLRLRRGVCVPRAPPSDSSSAAQFGSSALIFATMNGHLEVVKQLLKAGVDKEVQNFVRPPPGD